MQARLQQLPIECMARLVLQLVARIALNLAAGKYGIP